MPVFGYWIAQLIIKSSKMVYIQANTFVCMKSSIKKSTCYWIKLYLWVSLLIIIKLFFKRSNQKGSYITGFINPSKRNLPTDKRHTDELDCYSISFYTINFMKD